MVIVQKIHVEWGKESRGEPGATIKQVLFCKFRVRNIHCSLTIQ
jgi:hypothetical protein